MTWNSVDGYFLQACAVYSAAGRLYSYCNRINCVCEEGSTPPTMDEYKLAALLGASPLKACGCGFGHTCPDHLPVPRSPKKEEKRSTYSGGQKKFEVAPGNTRHWRRRRAKGKSPGGGMRVPRRRFRQTPRKMKRRRHRNAVHPSLMRRAALKSISEEAATDSIAS